MLNLDHPQTRHVFAASALEDALLASAQQLARLPLNERDALLAECASVLDTMRHLNHDHFGASPFIADALTQAKAALERLAQSDGAGDLEPFLQAKAKLESPQGFGTCFI